MDGRQLQSRQAVLPPGSTPKVATLRTPAGSGSRSLGGQQPHQQQQNTQILRAPTPQLRRRQKAEVGETADTASGRDMMAEAISWSENLTGHVECDLSLDGDGSCCALQADTVADATHEPVRTDVDFNGAEEGQRDPANAARKPTASAALRKMLELPTSSTFKHLNPRFPDAGPQGRERAPSPAAYCPSRYEEDHATEPSQSSEAKPASPEFGRSAASGTVRPCHAERVRPGSIAAVSSTSPPGTSFAPPSDTWARPYSPEEPERWQCSNPQLLGGPAPSPPAAARLDAADGGDRHPSSGAGDAASAAFTNNRQDRLSSILNFLDEVEEASRADASSRGSSAAACCSTRAAQDLASTPVMGMVPSAAVQDTGLGLGNETASMMKSRIALLETEVQDKKQIVGKMKAMLTEARSRAKQAVEAEAKECDKKLHQQKEQYEASLERQLKLVDRLLNDKNELTKRCELFTEELKTVERKFQRKIEDMEEQASKELARQKQNWNTAAKMRREAWEKDKVKEIKEMTIKGLQPEVERILAERKQDRLRLEEQNKEALEAQRQELQELSQSQVRAAREQLSREHEKALDSEREANRRKVREEYDRFSAQLQEERAKCAADLLAECRRHEQQLQQEVERKEIAVREAVAAERRQVEELTRTIKEKELEHEEQRRAAVTRQEEKQRREREEWERQHLEQAKEEKEALREELMREREAQRAELVKERDKQLDLLVDRLSREHVEQQRALKEESSALVAAARKDAEADAQKLAGELQDARRQVSSLENQLSSSKEAVKALQGQLALEVTSRNQLEARLQHWEGERDEELRKRDALLEKERAELMAMDASKQETITTLRAELEEASTQVAAEQAKVHELRKEQKLREERLIDGLEARVKRALQAKEDQINELRIRCTASENKVREFEYLLERQREELLSGLTREVLSTPR